MSRRASSSTPALTLLVALVAALLVTLTPASAHADDAGEAAPGTAEPTGVGADVDVKQPPTAVRVLPQSCLEEDDTMPATPTLCRVTRYGAQRPTVVVWGDSHSWQQTPAMIAMARQTRTNLITFQMGACPPADLTGTSFGTACAKNSAKALAFIKAKVRRSGSRGLTVVLGAFWHLYRDYAQRSARGWVPQTQHDDFMAREAAMFDAGGAKLFRTLDRLRVRTAAIGQMPWVAADAPACDAGPTTAYGCDLPRATAIEDEATISRWLAQRADLYVDATPYVCDTTTCHATVAGRPTFIDDLHLNPAITGGFAPAYARVFRAA